jgi:glycosyltransferase involved in cell wall biosynthesis
MSPDSVLVSVVLPTFNRAGTILRAVRSVLDQTHADLELVVVDDGSVDRTEEIVGGESDPRIRYIKLDRNRGQSVARNVGIRASRGALIAFQDSDDAWLPQKIERQLATIDGDAGAAGVYCDLLRIAATGQSYVINVTEPVVGALIEPRNRSYQTFGIGIQSCVLRKQSLTTVGGFREDMHCFEDLELLLRIVQRWPLRRVGEALVHYFESDGAVSRNLAAERRARLSMLRRYGLRIALSRPKFIVREIRTIRNLSRRLGNR